MNQDKNEIKPREEKDNEREKRMQEELDCLKEQLKKDEKATRHSESLEKNYPAEEFNTIEENKEEILNKENLKGNYGRNHQLGVFFAENKEILKFLSKVIISLLLVLCLIYHWFFYINISNGCFIFFKPSMLFEFNTGNIKEGIFVLKNAVPDEYKKLCTHVNVINANISCGGWQGGCYRGGPRANKKEIYISASRDQFVGWTAAVVAHETCHAIQFSQKRDMSESECYEIGDKVLKAAVQF
jgi:hypothetical protein